MYTKLQKVDTIQRIANASNPEELNFTEGLKTYLLNLSLMNCNKIEAL